MVNGVDQVCLTLLFDAALLRVTFQHIQVQYERNTHVEHNDRAQYPPEYKIQIGPPKSHNSFRVY